MVKGAIVCVDDERLVLIGLRDQLSRVLDGNYDIELAESGEEALALLTELTEAQIEIPLLICDQMMPGMSGEQFLIKVHTQYPQTRKILLTGQASLESVVKAINNANLYRYIAKPWDETDLSLTVKEAISSYFQAQQLVKQNATLQKINRVLQQEIDRRKHMEEQLTHDALHDALTGLPNRTLFMERVENALQRAKQNPDYLFAILFIDLDRFKVINDSLGHHVGDRLLIEIARKLEAIARTTDTSARLGGDEFVILLEPIQDLNDATDIAEQISTKLMPPLYLQGREIFTNASIGLALGLPSYEQGSELLRDADIAMYRAKQRGKACYEIFDRTMYVEALKRLNLENDLRNSIERNELQVYYQPIVSTQSRKVTSFEALVRWQHPQRGFISPGEFIPIAEETGLIVSIGEWVMHSVCQQITVWQTELAMTAPLRISINLSARQLSEPDFLDKIERILVQTGLQGHNLLLELTESMLMDNVEELIEILWRLKKRGIQLSIDDFGTGYSSLSYLHRFPVNYLKVDRSFVKDICNNAESFKIAELIVNLAHNLNMEAIAEGVETEEQFARMKALGCEYVQGYLFSPPVPADVAIDLVDCSNLHLSVLSQSKL